MVFNSMVSLYISVFGFVQLTTAVRLVSLQPYVHKYLSIKTTNACIFSTVYRK